MLPQLPKENADVNGIKSFGKVEVYYTLHPHSYLGSQIGQLFGKSVLTVPDLPSYHLCLQNGFREEVSRDLSRAKGETDWPIIHWIFLLA